MKKNKFAHARQNQQALAASNDSSSQQQLPRQNSPPLPTHSSKNKNNQPTEYPEETPRPFRSNSPPLPAQSKTQSEHANLRSSSPPLSGSGNKTAISDIDFGPNSLPPGASPSRPKVNSAPKKVDKENLTGQMTLTDTQIEPQQPPITPRRKSSATSNAINNISNNNGSAHASQTIANSNIHLERETYEDNDREGSNYSLVQQSPEPVVLEPFVAVGGAGKAKAFMDWLNDQA